MDTSLEAAERPAGEAVKLGRRLSRSKQSTTPMAGTLINTSMCKYSVVRNTAAALGWTECEEGRENWQMFWTDLSVNHTRVRALQPLQRINHFADMNRLCNKADGALILRALLRYFHVEYHFFPQSWSLPKETGAVVAQLQQAPGKPQASSCIILKPSRGCQGADITLVHSVEQLEAARHAMGGTASIVAQEYVDRPLLLDGYKFDLRLYVLVTSCVPLRIHLYRDGIARLCAEKYHAPTGGSAGKPGDAGGGGDWRFRHLTNYAINKQHPDFTIGADGTDGTKRRLGPVLNQLAACGHDVPRLWGEIQQLAVKALIAVQPTLAQAYMSCRPGPEVHPFSCFELLGLDVVVDERLKPWLLEVNHSPSLACDSPLDRNLKQALLEDTMRLCSFSMAEAALLRRAKRGTSAGATRVPAAPPRPADAPSLPTGGGSQSVRRRVDELMSSEIRRQTGFQRLASGRRLARGTTFGAMSASSGDAGADYATTPAPALVPRTLQSHLARRVGGGSAAAAAAASSRRLPGFKDVHDRRQETGALNAELLRLRIEYEAACDTNFELIHPASEPRLQMLYDLLQSTAQRAHAEANNARVIPPLLGAGNSFDSEWLPMFKLARAGERIYTAAADPPTGDPTRPDSSDASETD